MINLLPPDLKQAYHYAHRNVQLVRWAITCGLSLVGLAAISTFGLIYVQQTGLSYNGQIAAAKSSLQQQKLVTTQSEVRDISGSLKLAVQVLSKEVLFSKLLAQLAAITPSKAVLTDLTITQAESSVDITALASDYAAATQLQVNLADPANKLFVKADIVTITCGGASANSTYPCSVTLRALFATNNPFLFINNGGAN